MFLYECKTVCECKNEKSCLKKDFYAKISDLKKTTIKPTLTGFFTHFRVGFMCLVFWVRFFMPNLPETPWGP